MRNYLSQERSALQTENSSPTADAYSHAAHTVPISTKRVKKRTMRSMRYALTMRSIEKISDYRARRNPERCKKSIARIPNFARHIRLKTSDGNAFLETYFLFPRILSIQLPGVKNSMISSLRHSTAAFLSPRIK